MATMSKVQLLAAQILKAETLSEAQAFARAISDAESDDEPSANAIRPGPRSHRPGGLGGVLGVGVGFVGMSP